MFVFCFFSGRDTQGKLRFKLILFYFVSCVLCAFPIRGLDVHRYTTGLLWKHWSSFGQMSVTFTLSLSETSSTDRQGQTDGRTDARPSHYAFCCGRGQLNNSNSLIIAIIIIQRRTRIKTTSFLRLLCSNLTFYGVTQKRTSWQLTVRKVHAI